MSPGPCRGERSIVEREDGRFQWESWESVSPVGTSCVEHEGPPPVQGCHYIIRVAMQPSTHKERGFPRETLE